MNILKVQHTTKCLTQIILPGYSNPVSQQKMHVPGGDCTSVRHAITDATYGCSKRSFHEGVGGLFEAVCSILNHLNKTLNESIWSLNLKGPIVLIPALFNSTLSINSRLVVVGNLFPSSSLAVIQMFFVCSPA